MFSSSFLECHQRNISASFDWPHVRVCVFIFEIGERDVCK